VVRFNEKEFEVTGQFRDLTDDNIRIYYSSDEKKYCFRNNKTISRHAELIGKFPVVVLTPSDHSITQGYPADRRKFIDSVICQASETYLKNLLDYNKTLRQRSSLLYRIRERNAGVMKNWMHGLKDLLCQEQK
jgi:DNA replication and repair protein RecF